WRGTEICADWPRRAAGSCPGFLRTAARSRWRSPPGRRSLCDELNLLLGKWPSGVAHKHEGAQRYAFAQKRYTQQCSIIADLLPFVPVVPGVLQDVWNVYRAPFQYGPPGHRTRVWAMGMLSCKFCKVRFNIVDCGKVENAIIEFPNKGVVRLAKMRSDLNDL